MTQIKSFLKILGPGLLFASLAIGTSHLVLSTTAGATYGWLMVIPIILANVLKYPFFEFSVRYTNVTGKSLVEGYSRMGKSYMWIYAGITLVTTFTILAALYAVTAGLLINMLGLKDIPEHLVALGLFLFISLALIIGRYSLLESTLKIVVSILFAALLVTTALVIYKPAVAQIPNFSTPSIFNETGVLFLIGLIGWMPTAVEGSSWVSLWSLEKQKNLSKKTSLKEVLQEFKVGYYMTALLAVFFLIIGYRTLFGTGTELSGKAADFAQQLTEMFTTHIGSWAYLFIAVSAFATMFSTCMTAHDAISRVAVDVVKFLRPEEKRNSNSRQYAAAVLLLTAVNYVVLIALNANMGDLVALATFISFVLAPLVGYMNLKCVTGPDLAQKEQPGKGLRWLSYAGMFFLTFFAVYYCWLLLQ